MDDFCERRQCICALSLSRVSATLLAGLVLAFAPASAKGDFIDDAIFLLDSSGSIGAGNWSNLQNFVVDVLEPPGPGYWGPVATSQTAADALLASGRRLTVLEDDTRVGIVQFDTAATLAWSLADSQTRADVQAGVLALAYSGGATNTLDALQLALDEFGENSPSGASRYLFLLTDGIPYTPGTGVQDVCTLASAIQGAGITTILMPIGSGANPNLLDCLVLDAVNDVISVSDFSTASLNAAHAALYERLSEIPEPGTGVLLAMGLAGLGIRRKRR